MSVEHKETIEYVYCERWVQPTGWNLSWHEPIGMAIVSSGWSSEWGITGSAS